MGHSFRYTCLSGKEIKLLYRFRSEIERFSLSDPRKLHPCAVKNAHSQIKIQAFTRVRDRILTQNFIGSLDFFFNPYG